MKTMTKLLVVLTLTLASFSLPTTAWAGEVFRFNDQSANTFFSSTSGCIATDVFVFASENTSQNPPGPGNSSSGAGLFISQNSFRLLVGEQILRFAHD